MPALRRERREAELARWVRALPDDVVRVRPVLADRVRRRARAGGEFATRRRAAARRRAAGWRPTAARPAQPPPGMVVVDEDGYRSLPGAIEMYRAALALTAATSAATVDARQRGARPGPARTTTWAAAAAARWPGSRPGRRATSPARYAAYTESSRACGSAGHLADVLGCSITLGDLRVAQGRLGDAQRTYEQGLSSRPRPRRRPLRGTADMHVGLAEVLLERDDLAAAAEHLAAAERPRRAQRPAAVPVPLAGRPGPAPRGRGRPRRRARAARRGRRVYDGDYSPNVQPVPAVRARLHPPRRARHARGVGARTAAVADDEPVLPARVRARHAGPLLLARPHRARTRLAAARSACSTGCSRRPRRAAATGTVIEVLVLQALAPRPAATRPPRSARCSRAVALAEPEGYVRRLRRRGPPMAALLRGWPGDRAPRRTSAGSGRARTPARSPCRRRQPWSSRSATASSTCCGCWAPT